jgi:hypothetical protein
MTTLVHNLGLSSSLSFHDVFSIDDSDLLAFVPRPAYALLLVFPCSETYEKFRREEDAERKEYDGSGDGEPVVWYKQTIKNACGLIGLLHGVSNGEARDFIGRKLSLYIYIYSLLLTYSNRTLLRPLYSSHISHTSSPYPSSRPSLQFSRPRICPPICCCPRRHRRPLCR